jgi:hypothetical protein
MHNYDLDYQMCDAYENCVIPCDWLQISLVGLDMIPEWSGAQKCCKK